MTMQMPDEMSKVIHDCIRPTEWFETTVEKHTQEDTETTTKRFKDEDEADSYYADLIEKIEDDHEVIKITFKQYKFINGKKEIKTEDYVYEEECHCCVGRTLVAYEVCCMPNPEEFAEKCGVCQEYCCSNCRDWHSEVYICEDCQ